MIDLIVYCVVCVESQTLLEIQQCLLITVQCLLNAVRKQFFLHLVNCICPGRLKVLLKPDFDICSTGVVLILVLWQG